MKKNISVSLVVLVCIAFSALSVSGQKTSSKAEITYGPQPPNIAAISADSVIVISGSTYRFTVDTPEDKGLVTTNIRAKELPAQIASKDGSVQKYAVLDGKGVLKTESAIENGDRLQVISADGKTSKTYHIGTKNMALSGSLVLQQKAVTVGTLTDLVLYFTAGQRSPDARVKIYFPAGIEVNPNNTTVNVIGRGDVKLKDLPTQSIGRVGTKYSYKKVGDYSLSKTSNGGTVLVLEHLDLRPANGADLKMVVSGVKFVKPGNYPFSATYSTSKPEVFISPGTGRETTVLTVTNALSNFERVIAKNFQYKEDTETYTKLNFKFALSEVPAGIQLMQSLDRGKSWAPSAATIDKKKGTAAVSRLKPHQFYTFRLLIKGGMHKGFSNTVSFYSGKLDVKSFGAGADGKKDDTEAINKAITYLNHIGGGTLLFSEGTYNVRTVHLKSNVYLYVAKGAVIKAIKGADAPETTWFSDKKYRSGLSPTAPGPYADPENYMTKQDVGHHYFRNTMFFGERLDNVKIIGSGLITGDGNLVNGDNVMNNAPDNRADKMFTLKLCTNVEIGGLYRNEDLWYDPAKDEPYYILKDGTKSFNHDDMLKIERAGHFALLATGTDSINVHDTYFAKYHSTNARDIYDFMACNYVRVTNIYSKVSSDDIVKPGSDCSLGFTRPARDYKVRNIIGDTNCNLFQIGSETADDIKDICVDNIYVLGANKAGFSISTNDGAHISDIHLNCGHTGKLHSRSKMLRTRTPFFISISNRARILGAEVGRYVFMENGIKHDELLVKNVNIGQVENIIINGIDITEVYGGSSHGGKNGRWKAFDGKQNKATPIVAGYKLPDAEVVEGGLDFKLPNGQHTGYIKNIVFNDVHVLVKGGSPASDKDNIPPELGVGQYNVANLKVQPSYGLWARHVKDLAVSGSSFKYEQPDGRYAIFLDDVIGAKISDVKLTSGNEEVIGLKNAVNVQLDGKNL
ncbi:glycosyl hydrolase family 28-related protein [Pedobacter africanus]|uniref:Polygalacturonase n=1 Tax=Pedobacter africanus TaxID=151894 RepID=A0A1W2BCI5_9SPHI|nr:glycosyl hydrolase family 28-related protein [Pedobacter africanus]SMC70733.1 Polygalacturonase [Pedobacter africanus]